jgi:hypothetical protein
LIISFKDETAKIHIKIDTSPSKAIELMKTYQLTFILSKSQEKISKILKNSEKQQELLKILEF